MNVQIAEYQLRLEFARQFDGVFDVYQSIFATEKNFSLVGFHSGRGAEVFAEHPLFLGPVLEALLLGVEAHEGIFSTDDEFTFTSAGQDAEDVVGQQGRVVCVISFQFSGAVVVHAKPWSVCADIGQLVVRLIDGVYGAHVC